MCVGETFPISYIRIYVSNFQNYTKARNWVCESMQDGFTLITVQWCNDVDSQAKGAMSLLGTPEGTLLVTTVNDKIVHITTMNGTP
jgi:hypothetical protein